MADAHAAMALALADGRALLTIENRDLGTAIVEHVAVDWPDVSVLPESGRPNGLRKRRGRLRAANLLVDGRRLDLLADGTALPGGLTRVALTFEKGRLVVSGSVSAAGRDADFKGRVRLGAGVGRRLRVSVEDIRVQGAPPLPLSAIANAVLAAFGNHMQGEKREPQPQDALELDVLRPSLDELLVAEGWRLPDSSSLRLSSAVVSVRGSGAVVGRRRRARRAAAGRHGADVAGLRGAARRAASLGRRRSPRPRAGAGGAEARGGVRTRERRARRGRRATEFASRTPARARWSGPRGGGWSSCTRGVATRTPRRAR